MNFRIHRSDYTGNFPEVLYSNSEACKPICRQHQRTRSPILCSRILLCKLRCPWPCHSRFCCVLVHRRVTSDRVREIHTHRFAKHLKHTNLSPFSSPGLKFTIIFLPPLSTSTTQNLDAPQCTYTFPKRPSTTNPIQTSASPLVRPPL